MRIAFMGTPEFAVPSLARLCEHGHTLCAVYTQPDKPKNRGMKLQYSPVKEYAITRKIPVFQPETLKTPASVEALYSLRPDLIVVVAYGRILPAPLLELAPLGCVNVHASLLPRYRGPAPIHWAILNGERETGVTIMHLAPTLDTGDIILSAATPIGPEETAQQLYDRLKELGAALLCDAAAALEKGTAPRREQDHTQATYAPMLTRALSPVDWTRTAEELHNQVRALVPWPSAVAVLGHTRFKLHAVSPLSQETEDEPGTILSCGREGIAVACGGGTVLCVRELQVEGGKRMAAAEYLRGHPAGSF